MGENAAKRVRLSGAQILVEFSVGQEMRCVTRAGVAQEPTP